MRSLRARLFLLLLVATGLVWASAVAWIYVSTQAQIERVLDARLSEAATMVHSLMAGQGVAPQGAARVAADRSARPQETPYSRQLSCQIWSLDGKLLARSDGAPKEVFFASGSGFAETTIDGESWRVYAVDDPALNVRVIVGDNLKMRDRLVAGVIEGLLFPALLILPLLAGLIWLSIGTGLSPLRRLAATLTARGPLNLQPVTEANAAIEIRPVIQSLNGLLGRVETARRRERDFISFAAHELRTPLAGLKTQAQVALSVQDDRKRERALQQIAISVDRTARLVRQLLDMSEAEHGEAGQATGRTRVAPLLGPLGDDLTKQTGSGVRVVIDSSLADVELNVDPALFQLAARNLLENAVAHSPPGGVVQCRLAASGPQTAIEILDEGAGIPPGDLTRAVEPFFRGRLKSPVGSGLGLAIVDMAQRKAGGALTLENRTQGGLCARMTFPAAESAEARRSLPEP